MNAYLGIVMSTALIMLGGTTMTSMDSQPHPASIVQVPAYKVVSPTINKQVENVWNNIRMEGGVHTIVVDGKSYAVISLGKRPTGGYLIHLDNVVQSTDGSIRVDVSEKKPAADTMTTQVITYPTIVLEMQTAQPVHVKIN